MTHRCALKLSLVLLSQPHTPLRTPRITAEASGVHGNLDTVLSIGQLSPHDKMLNVEAFLLSQWEEREQWDRWLDSPLLSHFDAALTLKNKYDAAVGIREAGTPYSHIFEIAGFPIFDIDYSHYKRDMCLPTIDNTQIRLLRDKQSVLLIDIDVVTGKTLRAVTIYLRDKGVKVNGAYLGLNKWQGVKSRAFHIGSDTVDFDVFWKGRNYGLSRLRSRCPYNKGVIPRDLALYTSNPDLEEKELLGSRVARQIAKYFKANEL